MATTMMMMTTTVPATTLKDDSNASGASDDATANGSGGGEEDGEDHNNSNSWSHHFHDEEALVVNEADINNATLEKPSALVAQDDAAAVDVWEQDLHPLHQQQQAAIMMVDHLPPQLHPAVSAGIRHVSSCYFSVSSEISTSNSRVGSVADLLCLLDEAAQQQQQQQEQENDPYHVLPDDSSGEKCSSPSGNNNTNNQSTILAGAATSTAVAPTSSDIFVNHDVLMNVLTFLDAKSLAAFSETTRRLNFEVFYFLQLQLQRSLLIMVAGSSSYYNHHRQHQHHSSSQNTTEMLLQEAASAAANATAPAVSSTADRGSSLLNQPSQQQYSANLVTDRSLSDIPGVASMARLAAMEPGEAQELVRLFLDSNSSLSTQHLPLSHSMAYLRQFLLRHAAGSPQNNQGPLSSSQANTTMASAVLLVTLVGAASLVGAGAEGLPELAAAACSQASAEMIPNLLLKLGFVGGLMGAAKSMACTTTDQQQQQATNNSNMRERAEQMACKMQSLLFTNTDNNTKELHGVVQDSLDTVAPWTSNPYEHLPTSECCYTPTMDRTAEDQDEPEPPPPRSSCSSSNSEPPPVKRKTPTGCVGAYWKVVSRASARVTQLVKDKRAATFQALPRQEQAQLASTLIDACGSHGSLSVVQDLIQKCACMDVDGFYASHTVGGAAGGAGGGDDENGGVARACALHTAAYYGSCDVLDFLCRGIDEQLCHCAQDGGLCNVNLQDANGNTALHFAVMGVNNDDSSDTTRAVIEILVNHGADLQLEADNGYTPLQWAVRLQNHAAAKELRKQLEIQSEKQRLQRLGGWMNLPRKHHLSAIAKRFFDLVHSQA